MMKDRLLPHIEHIKTSPDDGFTRETFETPGGRTITVSLLTDPSFGHLRASTYIDSINEHTKMAGSTTALYTRARDLMQQTADARREVLTYTFRTFELSMIEWARTQGKELFEWVDFHQPEPYEQ
jgi:hypothetical protein